MERTRPSRQWSKVALLVLLPFLVYLPSRHGEFLYDGTRWIAENPRVIESDQYLRIWTDTSQDDFWPLTYSVFWIEWQLWNVNTFPYHVFSITLHIINSLLVWRILQRLRVPGAWLASLVFAVHPVNAVATAWIFQQKTLLAASFGFASTLQFLKYEKKRSQNTLILSWFFFVASLLCKTSTIMLPVVFVGLTQMQEGKSTWQKFRHVMPFFPVSLAFGLITIWFQSHSIRVLELPVEVGFLERLAGVGYVLSLYFAKSFVPLHLSFVYPHWSFNSGTVLSYLPLLAVVLVAAVLLYYRKTWGRPALATLCYVAVILFPVLGFWQLNFMRYSQVADHWQYLALPASIAFFVAVCHRALISQSTRIQQLAIVSAAVCVFALSILTFQRSATYIAELTLWSDSITKNPHSAMLYDNFSVWLNKRGVSLQNETFRRSARRLAEKSLSLDPNGPVTHMNLARLERLDGNLAGAIHHYQKILKILPEDALTHVELANVYAERGEFELAIEHYKIALSLVPESFELHERLRRQINEISER